MGAVEDWKKKLDVRASFEEWNGLEGGTDYPSGRAAFYISPAHCEVKLTRHGQRSHGSQNYFETSKEVNRVLVAAIVENWDSIKSSALRIMVEDENAALIKCKAYVENMVAAIADAEKAMADKH
jgi:hypothetical protein